MGGADRLNGPGKQSSSDEIMEICLFEPVAQRAKAALELFGIKIEWNAGT